MNTTREEVKRMLLAGRRITKLDLFNESQVHSSCLPQRIYDIRHEDGWDIKWQSVKGKGTLREYWLEPSEIARIKGEKEYVEPRKDEEDQLHFATEKTAPKAQKHATEQLGIGLLGGHNY